MFYAINVAVGLSVAVPGFANRIAHGLLGELPFGAVSLVGRGWVRGSVCVCRGAGCSTGQCVMQESGSVRGAGDEVCLGPPAGPDPTPPAAITVITAYPPAAITTTV